MIDQRKGKMMATYCVTFRISSKTVNGKSYAERYSALVDILSEGSDGYWSEPTSFILVGSNMNTEEFTERACDALEESVDMLFVFDPADMSANYFGAIEREDIIQSFFPLARKI